MPVNKEHLLQVLELWYCVVTIPCSLTAFLPDDTCKEGVDVWVTRPGNHHQECPGVNTNSSWRPGGPLVL